MRSVKRIYDVPDWGLCTGCGACAYFCNKGAVSLENIECVGIRPIFKRDICAECDGCLEICPGIRVELGNGCTNIPLKSDLLIGNSVDIWEGFAADSELRFQASSGGLLSALSLYCLDKEDIGFILHTGTDGAKPWVNKTVQSRSRSDLLGRCGSRYAPSSPCDSLRLIEESDKPCVFIGKPCDVAAIAQLRKLRPRLDANLALVMTFFCAGTPSTKGTLELLDVLAIGPNAVEAIHYRGSGWPGDFRVELKSNENIKSLSYESSWGFLQKYRCFRCHLCPDGMGELADLSCGDAWHRLGEEQEGISLVLVRTDRGQEILRRAMECGYLSLVRSSASDVISAQGLAQRRREIFGRLLAMKALLIPTPRFHGFSLLEAWMGNTGSSKIHSIFGTFKRILLRGLWHRNPP